MGFQAASRPKLASLDKLIQAWLPKLGGVPDPKAEPTADDLSGLYEIVRMLCSLRWEPDGDNDLPIWPPEFRVLRLFEREHWSPLPQWRQIEAGAIVWEDRLRAARYNLTAAMRDLESTLDVHRIDNPIGKLKPEEILGDPPKVWWSFQRDLEARLARAEERNTEQHATIEKLREALRVAKGEKK